ncbi:uncharacterized protein BO80DRAFT_390341 [Aspergillus ibericus CBS 121593]|uniref:Glycine zipper 2TM domain-containing protein n=1 Tax=Aspergillus ibericus CBS 121593 TaxID=1448316 RepID=A0A395GP58_9EURO|nr:hypothetical protein BO80DRAFT_390341 [Aspergillus ibericus CBS 121593]RAK97132.1 hypothetical protein BO80DRAFT_390341 [Aspergillus ibericus CBS 121593]
MSDPYPRHPSYPPASASASAPGTSNEATSPYYSPPDGVYQHPPYDYDPQQFYNQHHVPPNQDPAYSSQYDVSQIPRSYPAQWVQPDAPLQQPYDADRLAPQYEPPVRRGSNADYYNQSAVDLAQVAEPTNEQDPNAPKGEGEDEGERSLGGAVLGGATGYYLGHKKEHGLLGAVGGALLGNFIGDKLKDRKEKESDDEYSYHSRRTRTSSSHSHGHGHGHHHHHHHHHHGHHHEHGHRSRSRHSGFEEEY